MQDEAVVSSDPSLRAGVRCTVAGSCPARGGIRSCDSSSPVLMMRPHFCCSMWGRAAFVVWNAELRHTAMMASHLSSGNS